MFLFAILKFQAGYIDEVLQLSYLVSVESPRSEFHLATLLVEWKIFHVNRTRTLVDRRWNPQHVTLAVNDHVL